MLLSKRKRAECRLLGASKAERAARQSRASRDSALEHEKQLAVVDAVEWAVERWASRDRVELTAADPRASHATRLIAALVYLDSRFQQLAPDFVTELIEAVAGAAREGAARPQLDAKAAATLLTVEVGAFSR